MHRLAISSLVYFLSWSVCREDQLAPINTLFSQASPASQQRLKPSSTSQLKASGPPGRGPDPASSQPASQAASFADNISGMFGGMFRHSLPRRFSNDGVSPIQWHVQTQFTNIVCQMPGLRLSGQIGSSIAKLSLYKYVCSVEMSISRPDFALFRTLFKTLT